MQNNVSRKSSQDIEVHVIMYIPKKAEIQCLMCTPIFFDIRQLDNSHIENDAEKCHHLRSTGVSPVCENASRSGWSSTYSVLCISVGFSHQ